MPSMERVIKTHDEVIRNIDGLSLLE